MIIHEGLQISSPKKIATIANNFFINKIVTLREGFQKQNVSPIEILSALTPRNENVFTLPLISLNETKLLIKNLKNSNATGYDVITNRVLKKICDVISPHITHMINAIIRSERVPIAFKTSRITPISKPDKPSNLISSFRPINNLVCLDKLLEQHVLNHLTLFLNQNNVIHKNNHGGRQKHSTTTALIQINNILHQNMDNDKISAVMTTDLTSAFDTVDRSILIKKMDHYGIRGPELRLLSDYLTNRKQYVEVDTFRSETLNCPPCSVIQGGKLSGVLYTLYTNEIPLLFKLMNNDIFTKLTNNPQSNYNIIDQKTINFIDDSTAIMTFPNTSDIKKIPHQLLPTFTQILQCKFFAYQF